MIDTQDPIIQMLTMQDYEISAHVYLKYGFLQFSYTARHANKKTLHGRSRVSAPRALADLAKKAGIAAQNAVHAIRWAADDALPESRPETTRNRTGGAVGIESRGHVHDSCTKP